jgi:NitT/TauT family transport system substrate-binding protein
MTLRHGKIALLTVAASIFFGWGSATAQQTATIRVAAPATADVAPLVYGLKKGLFARAGLTVEFAQMATGSSVTQAVAGGSIDVGYSALTALIAGHSRGIPFTLIAPAGFYRSESPAAYMVVRKDSTLKSGGDFAGKTIGVPSLKDLDAVASSAWIEANGGMLSSVRFIELPSPSLLPALVDGRIDAFTNADPWITLAIDSGRTRVVSKAFDGIATHFLYTAWFATNKYVDDNRGIVERFERVLRDAAIEANAHRSEVVPIIADYTKLEPAVIAKMLKEFYTGPLDPKLIQPLIDASVKYHVTDKPFEAAEFISPAALKPAK